MANLLENAALWSDGTVSPPALWNGTAYVFTAPATITYTGTVAAGDVLDSTFAYTPTGDVNAGHLIAVLINGVDAISWASSLDSYPSDINFTLSDGDTVQIVGKTDGCGYPPTFSITPIPVPVPFTPGDLVRQQTTHRVYRGIDSALKCYVRNEVGRVDLSTATTIEAKLYRYGVTWPFATLNATGDANGLATFTVPASLLRTSGLGYDYGLTTQPFNLMRFDVFADGVLVYTALIEIV